MKQVRGSQNQNVNMQNTGQELKVLHEIGYLLIDYLIQTTQNGLLHLMIFAYFDMGTKKI